MKKRAIHEIENAEVSKNSGILKVMAVF